MKLKYWSFVLILVFLTCIQVQAAPTQEIKQKIIAQANASGVDPAIMLSIAKTESGFRQEAIGASGTVGVFQLLPSTAKGLGYNPYNLDENIKCGIIYYKNLYNMFGSTEKALAAYNAGSGTVRRCNCIPAQCQRFVNKIMTDYQYFKTQI